MVLGHLLRGGSPTAFDRVLGLRFGAAAVRGLAAGYDGVMVAAQPADRRLRAAVRGDPTDEVRSAGLRLDAHGPRARRQLRRPDAVRTPVRQVDCRRGRAVGLSRRSSASSPCRGSRGDLPSSTRCQGLGEAEEHGVAGIGGDGPQLLEPTPTASGVVGAQCRHDPAEAGDCAVEVARPGALRRPLRRRSGPLRHRRRGPAPALAPTGRRGSRRRRRSSIAARASSTRPSWLSASERTTTASPSDAPIAWCRASTCSDSTRACSALPRCIATAAAPCNARPSSPNEWPRLIDSSAPRWASAFLPRATWARVSGPSALITP